MAHVCDVVVVGAGPGGLAAAFRASSLGLSVTVLERKRVIGYPVNCGEFALVGSSIREFMPDSRDLHSFYYVVDRARVSRERHLLVRLPEQEFLIEVDFQFIDRTKMESSLASMVEREGGEVVTNNEVVAIRREGGMWLVRTRRGREFRGRVLVGADGYPSLVAVATGLHTELNSIDKAYVVHERYDGVSGACHAEIVIGPVAPGGYAWFFVRGDGQCDVGLGLRAGRANPIPFFEVYKRAFTRFLNGARLKYRLGKVLPVGGMFSRVCGRGVLLVGDAAGLVCPSNGSGIATAIESGLLAGLAAAKHLTGEAPLSTYEKMLKRSLAPLLDRSAMFRRVADLFLFDARKLSLLSRSPLFAALLDRALKCKPVAPRLIEAAINYFSIGWTKLALLC